MFDRFTDDAKRSMMHAREAALRHRLKIIRSEHLLLGLLDVPGGVATRAVTEFCGGPEAVRKRIAQDMTQGKGGRVDQMPFSADSKRALEFVLEEASSPAKQHLISLKPGPITDGDLLIGLIREPHGLAGRVLRELGMTVELLRAFLGGGQPS